MEILIQPNKIEEVILYILEKLNRDLGSIELAKYLYLVDIESMRFTGESITRQTYLRAQQGPLAKDFKDSTTHMDGHELEIEIISNINNSGKEKHVHKLGKKPRFTPNLNLIETAIINRVLGRNFNKTIGQLKKIAYKTKPWEAVKKYEKDNGEIYKGAIDLCDEKKIQADIEWEDNIQKKPQFEQEYKDYLEEESKEFDKLIASIA